MASLEIRPIPRDGLSSVMEDFAEIEDILPEERDLALAVLDWWYFENPVGEGVYVGAFEGSKLVGMAGITPKRFSIRGRPVVGAEIGRTITHANFRGRGIFSKLVKFLVNEADRRDYRMVYGTPNEASGHTYLGKLDFSAFFHWNRFLRPVDWKKQPQVLGGVGRAIAPIVGRVWNLLFPLGSGFHDYTVEPAVREELCLFLRDATADVGCVLERSPEYLRWRFARPDRKYEHVYLWDREGRLRGWAVVLFVLVEGRQRAHIGDFWVHPWTTKNLRALITAVRNESLRRNAVEIYIGSRTRETSGLRPPTGFLSQKSAMPLIAISPAGGLLEFESWEYRDADADMY